MKNKKIITNHQEQALFSITVIFTMKATVIEI